MIGKWELLVLTCFCRNLNALFFEVGGDRKLFLCFYYILSLLMNGKTIEKHYDFSSIWFLNVDCS